MIFMNNVLQMVVFKVPQHKMLLIMVGADNNECEKSMGKHDNGKCLIDFLLNNNQMIGGTMFPHKDVHTLTWKSPYGRKTNQVDHIRGADANSDLSTTC